MFWQLDGSGSGKSSSYSIPNAYQCLGSYIFTDPKGELYDRTAGYLRKKGYKTEKVNLIIRSTGATRRFSKDHCFILVNPKKKFEFYNPSTWGTKSVVVDPWLGFVSRKDDAISKYASFFDITDDEFFIFTSIQ